MRALRFDKPCLRSTDVRPNAAGALCSMIAKKMTMDNDVEGVVEDAPSAIPSAQACTMSPMVAAGVFLDADAGSPGVCRGVTAALSMAMPLRLKCELLCGPRAKLDSEMCMAWYFGLAEDMASGRWSMRNMSI